jgi:hypothetical protein
MRIVASVMATLVALTTGVMAQENLAKTAKETSAKYQDCIVHVTATMKIEASGMGMMMGQGNEQKMETIGTIVDPSGLTVVSLSKMDPTSMFAGMSINVNGEDQEISAGSQFSDVKIRLADGTEVPAKLIMKEPELDLAFVIPEKNDDGKKYNFLNLSESGTVDVLDDLFTLDRFGKVLNYKPAIGKMYVVGVVAKPKLSYAINDASDLGVPAFNAAGKLIGICTLKTSQDKSRGIMAMATGGGMHPIILPAADVLDTAKQALAKKDEKKEEPKKEAKKDEKKAEEKK